MRPVSAIIETRLNNPIQTKATNADPELILWISRPVTPLVNSALLESQDVQTGTATRSRPTIAVCHPLLGRGSTKIYIGYIEDGIGKVVSSPFREDMALHSWTDAGLTDSAVDLALCFDGTFQKTYRGTQEFVTERTPWVFRVTSDGHLYGAKLGDDWTELASANCTAVSAVRATWSDIDGFDFGLCLFFILTGAIYYRQLIGGEWTDAAPIGFGPETTFTDIAATRTWDYRIALQAKASDGTVYELFTQYGGIGTRTGDHLEIRNVTATSELTYITRHETKEDEHISITAAGTAPYGGLYAIGVPSIVSAYNLDDGTGDMGKKAVFVFDIHLVAADVAAQNAAFTIVDENNISYAAATATLGEDGKTVTLTFADFNNASGECQAKYTAGTVQSMAGTALETVTHSFTPTGLVPSALPVPELLNIWNE